jgi:outer membrane protein assembly factor BamE (lipoprotein component of BamABCDE complex)
VDKDKKQQIMGTAASIVLVVAVVVLGWHFYSKSVGKKKAFDLFSQAGIPAEKLAQIKIGMTKDEVLAITGEPLGKNVFEDGKTERWDWLVDMVVFENGKVTYAGSSRVHHTTPGSEEPGSNAPPVTPPGGG